MTGRQEGVYLGSRRGLLDGSSSCGGSCSKTGQDMRGTVSSAP